VVVHRTGFLSPGHHDELWGTVLALHKDVEVSSLESIRQKAPTNLLEEFVDREKPVEP